MTKYHIYLINSAGRRFKIVKANKETGDIVLENEKGEQFESTMAHAKGYTIEKVAYDVPDEPEKSVNRKEQRKMMNDLRQEVQPFLERLQAVKVDSLSVGDYKRLQLAVKRLQNFLGD